MKTFLFATAAACAFISYSQAAQAAPAGNNAVLDEVVVTAEKREQKIDKVPEAITAFTSKQRDLIGLDSMQDYTNFTPGLSYSSGNDRLFLRGVGRETNTVGSDPGVATYVDGVYNSATVSAAGDELFIDRAEILRGPQGTLYGRNSIGGAINAISRRPTDTFSAEARATFGSYGVSNFEAAVSGPIVPGLRFHLAGYANEQRDGYFKNLAGGPSEGGRSRGQYLEAQVDAKLGEHADIWVKVFTQNSTANPRTTNVTDAYDYSAYPAGGLSPGSAFGYLTAGYSALGNCATNPGISNPRNFCTNTPQTARLSPDSGVAVQATWHATDLDIKYIGGYQHYVYNQTTELDNTAVKSYQFPCDPFSLCSGIPGLFPGVGPLTIYATQQFNYVEDKTFQSHELDFTSTTNGPLQWVGGLYYYHEDFTQQDHFAMPLQPQILAPYNILGSALAQPNPSGDVVYANGNLQATSYAVFAQADWQATNTVKFTGGLRYTDDQKSGNERFRALCLTAACISPGQYGIYTQALDITASPSIISYAIDPGVVAAPTIDPATGIAKRYLSGRWSATTGTAGVSWTPDDQTLAYGRYSRGYKSGGFNAGGISPHPETAPEYVNSFEVGVKRQFGKSIQVNAALFRYDYQNLQVPLTVVTPGVAMTEFVNLKDVVSQGFELEAHWQATHSLQFLLSYGYLDATIRKACCFVNGANGLTESVVGETVPESPRNKIGINGNYTFEFEQGSLNLSVSGIWKAATYDSIFNRPYNLAPSYSQVDLRSTWTDKHNRYSVIGFAKNVFDTLGYDSVTGATGTAARTVSLTPPRTFGVQLQYRF